MQKAEASVRAMPVAVLNDVLFPYEQVDSHAG